MAKFGSNFVRHFEVLEVVNYINIVDVEGERTPVNLSQVRVYTFRNDSESSQMASGYSQLLRLRESPCGSQCLLKDKFHSPKKFVQVSIIVFS